MKKMAQISSSSSGSSTASSGEEEEEVTAPAPITTTTTTTPPKPRSPDSSSSDEEEDDADHSDSASEDDKPPPPPTHQQQIQPLAPITTTPLNHVILIPPPATRKKTMPIFPIPHPKTTSRLGIQPPSKQTAATKPPPDLRHSTRVADPSIKPISSRPLPPAAPSLKEPEGEHQNGEGKKRHLFQRIWSEEDEITVLRGLIAYRAKNGHLPLPSNIDHFQQIIENDVHIKATKNQLVKKIRSLKHKFLKPSTRAKSGLCYDLSKEIWGENDNTPGDLKTGKRKKPPKDCEAPPSASKKVKHEEKIAAADVINVETTPTYRFLREAMFKMGSAYVGGLVVARRKMELIGDAEAAVLEEQYKKLRVLELNHRLQEIAIMNEMVKLVLDG